MLERPEILVVLLIVFIAIIAMIIFIDGDYDDLGGND